MRFLSSLIAIFLCAQLVADHGHAFGRKRKAKAGKSQVIGAIDIVDSSGMVAGWAGDKSRASSSIDVRYFVDTPSTTGEPAGGAVANVPRGDLGGVGLGTGDHGFNFKLPSRFLDGQPHKLYVYGMTPTNALVALSGSPKDFTASWIERVSVVDEKGEVPANVTAELRPDDETGPYPATYADGVLSFTLGANTTPGWGATLVINGDGYDESYTRIVLNEEAPRQVTLQSARAFPPEHGRLTVRDRFFYDENNQVWQWRGATMFLLPCRFILGEDITPQIRWMQKHGMNVARVFIAGVEWASHPQCGHPFDQPDYDTKISQFFDRMAEEGLRVEATVVTHQMDNRKWSQVLQRVYDVASTKWNVMVEVTNEPWVGHGDPIVISQGVNRRGVLSAYGYQPDTTQVLAPCPALDYVTVHLPRDLGHYPRNSKDLWEIREMMRKPIIGDEPLGVADYDKQGAGARSTNRIFHVSHFSICNLLSAGCTIHSQAGLEGRRPSEAEPITEQIVSSITDVWKFIPAASQTGAYSRPGLSNWPDESVSSDSTLDHPYAALGSNEAWMIVPLARPGWVPRPINGWQVDSFGPESWIVKLRR